MIEKIFRAPADNISVQTFRYILAGTLAYMIDYGTLIALTDIAGVYYLTSAAIAFTIGAAVSYGLNVSWVFDKRTFDDRRVEAGIFVSIGIVSLILNHFCILFFTESVKCHYLFSKFISTVVVSAVNFLARKYILFR